MSTHVSCGAILYRLMDLRVTPTMRTVGVFIGYGRLVHPQGNYNGKPTVALYSCPEGYFYE